MKQEIMRFIFEKYLSDFHLDLPELNEKLKGTLISQSKTFLTSKLWQFIKERTLSSVQREISFKTKNDLEISYQRGIARGIQIVEEEMKKYATLKNETDH